MRKRARVVLGGLALGLLPALAAAQAGAAPKTLGGAGAAKGAVMTRSELRACLKEQGAQKARAAELEQRRGEIRAEADAVRQQKESVQAERDAYAAKAAQAQAFNARVQAHGERVALYNQQVKDFTDHPPKGADAERQRGQIEAEGEALAKADAAIKAEAAQWTATTDSLRAALAEHVRAQQAAAAAAIEHHRAFNDDAKAYDDQLTDWQARCGNRPYLEADEKALRAEK